MPNTMKSIALALLLAAMPTQAFAAANIKLKVAAEKDAVVLVKDKKVTKRIPAKSIEPGELLFYTLNYENAGDEAATDVVFNNPIPANTFYVTDSASGKNSQITFSADNGKTFTRPTQVTYEFKKPDGKVVTRKASPEQYTNIRWVVNKIDPGKKGQLRFQVRVK